MTSVKFLLRQQTTSVVICRMAQTQFTNSLFPGNPVFIAVTLYLDYLLFRYFQYAFHLGDSFRFGAKVRKGFRLCYTCWPDAFIHPALFYFFKEKPSKLLALVLTHRKSLIYPKCSYTFLCKDVCHQRYKGYPKCSYIFLCKYAFHPKYTRCQKYWYICHDIHAYHPMCTECLTYSYNGRDKDAFRPMYIRWLMC